MLEVRTIIEMPSGLVVNVTMHDTEQDIPAIEGHIIGPSGGNIGDTWNGVEYVPPPPPPPPPATADNVREEAQRRIMALMGARDLNDCIIKQLNANKTAVALNDKRINGEVLTAEEEATATALRNLAAAIDAIRAASNVIEPNPPADYTDDQYWP